MQALSEFQCTGSRFLSPIVSQLWLGILSRPRLFGLFLQPSLFLFFGLLRGFGDIPHSIRLATVESEVIEVDMTPTTGVPIHEADEDLFSDGSPEVDAHSTKILLGGAASAREEFTGILKDQFDTSGAVWTAADEERGPRVCHFERHRCEG